MVFRTELCLHRYRCWFAAALQLFKIWCCVWTVPLQRGHVSVGIRFHVFKFLLVGKASINARRKKENMFFGKLLATLFHAVILDDVHTSNRNLTIMFCFFSWTNSPQISFSVCAFKSFLHADFCWSAFPCAFFWPSSTRRSEFTFLKWVSTYSLRIFRSFEFLSIFRTFTLQWLYTCDGKDKFSPNFLRGNARWTVFAPGWKLSHFLTNRSIKLSNDCFNHVVSKV